jgi:hypothetical protein
METPVQIVTNKLAANELITWQDAAALLHEYQRFELELANAEQIVELVERDRRVSTRYFLDQLAIARVREKELISALLSARGGLCVAAMKDGTAEMIDGVIGKRQ